MCKRTLSFMLLSFIAFIGLATAGNYARLEVSYSLKRVGDRAFDDKVVYVWISSEEAFSGELPDVGRKLGITTDGKGRFTEFHLISGILGLGWDLKAVEATPSHFAQADGLKFYRERTRIFHFTKPDSQRPGPAVKGGEPSAGSQSK